MAKNAAHQHPGSRIQDPASNAEKVLHSIFSAFPETISLEILHNGQYNVNIQEITEIH